MSRLPVSSILRSRPTAPIIPHTPSTYKPITLIQQQRSYAGGGEEDSKGNGGGTSKADNPTHNTQQNSSSSSKGGNDAQPKILNESIPAEESEEVKQHNADLAKRHDRAETHADDESIKVDKKYWSDSRLFSLVPLGPFKTNHVCTGRNGLC